MTDLSIDLVAYLEKLTLEEDIDLLHDSLKMVVQLLMEADVSAQIQAHKYERTEERETYRNGYRGRDWETRVGEMELAIPKLRQGSYYPDWLLDPRRPGEKALLNVVQAAYVQGVGTRRMEKVVEGLGLDHLDKSKVSRMTKKLNAEVEAFRTRALEGPYPYVWVDALYPKVRQNHRVVSQALVVAVGVNADGHRTVLGFAMGAAETEAFWKEFLRSLIRRGLRGVQLVVSDAHEGLKSALRQVMHGASWQRCRTHFMRNLLAHIPQDDKEEAASWVRTIFAQPSQEAAQQQVEVVVEKLQPAWPDAAQLLRDAAPDLLAHTAFPKAHWRRLATNNMVERLNREIRRRIDVVQVFPDRSAALRLIGAILMETNTDWVGGRRYFSATSMQAVLPEPMEQETQPVYLDF
jgi:transposase-like protein